MCKCPTGTEYCDWFVKDKTTDEPLIGVNVIIKGTAIGVITDFDGKYVIKATPKDVLVFSFIGLNSKEEVVGNRTTINVELSDEGIEIDEVVVTAMGIERKAKSLTYATQRVGSKELTRAKETNMINSLQGKTSGWVITPNASGAGGSSKLIIRGNKSAQGNNQPLIVIDGMPMSNYTSSQLEDGYGGRDGGDALSNINPDDIASINVLKGASAAALYGSMAANGVVLISTKKGREGKIRVDFSTSATFENAVATPNIQTEYGAVVAADGSLTQSSWDTTKLTGEKKGANRVDDFFQTGSTYINSIAISGGSEKTQSYLSYANTTANGIMETNKFQRHNMTLKETMKLLDDKLTLTGSINFISQKIKNRPEGGTYRNALTGLYSFPANGDWNYYKNNYKAFDSANNWDAQQWYMNIDQDFSANPYWVLHKNEHKETRNRIIASGSAKYDVNKYLNVQGRLSYDKSTDTYDRRLFATTSHTLISPNGEYNYETANNRQFYGDLMMNFNKSYGDYSVSATLGTSFTDSRNWGNIFFTEGGMLYPNQFNTSNSAKNGSGQYETRQRLNSVFATAQLGWKDAIFMDITGRNDWSSTLSFTPNTSYFYPSVGLTAVISDLVEMPKMINLFKLRATYSIVGNSMPPYITNPLSTISRKTGNIEFNTTASFSDMKPEKLKSFEVGFDLAMFNNRFNWDVTFYKSNNTNQYFKMEVPRGTGYSALYFNAGNIQNTGIETTVSGTLSLSDKLQWNTAFNLSYNDNKIKELDNRDGIDDADRLKYAKLATISGLEFRLVEGGSYGDVYSKVVLKDANGVTQVAADGNTVLLSYEYQKVGNLNSKWNMGWSNTFSYGDYSLYFLIDGRVGGNFLDATQAKLASYGVTQETADARNNGGVDLGNGTKVDAENYYNTVTSNTDEYLYSATNFRLREVSVGYTFRNMFGISKNLSVNLVARNLFFIYKDSPSDPDLSVSTNNGWSGISYFALPSTRSFGINLKATF
ncbi:MAG: SusC/RagA family TonB-linked outer membrane protein [Bacteroidaceae bacterium]|nr:SusC/RagA family TonB-linked outer membrane protein [Bacteroidaceae bacterium]